MEFVYALLLGAAVAAFVSRPFWGRGTASTAEDPRLAALEAAREAKYREIRDAETDLASGKLSREDFDQVNADLRRDAAGILKQLDDAKAEAATPGDARHQTAPAAEESPKDDDS